MNPALSLSFKNHHTSSGRQLISLTPLIDVVFILLIFFMLASNFMEWVSIKVSVAPVSEMQSFDEQESMIVLVSDTELWFNEEALALTQVSERVYAHLQRYPDALLHIQAKDNTAIQSVIVVLDKLQKAGISEFTLVVDPNWKMSQ